MAIIHERRWGAAAAAFAMALAVTSPAAFAAPDNPLAGLGSLKQVTVTATVKSIDPATRHIVLTSADGQDVTIKAPEEMRNFGQLQVGHRVAATYTIETEFALSPGDKLPPNTLAVIEARAAKGELPAAAVANHMVLTGAILGIDRANHTVRVVNPRGGEVHTIDVREAAGRAALGKLKVGDYVTAYITERMLISVRPA